MAPSTAIGSAGGGTRRRVVESGAPNAYSADAEILARGEHAVVVEAAIEGLPFAVADEVGEVRRRGDWHGLE